MSELNDAQDGATEPQAAPWPAEAVPTGDEGVDSALAQLQEIPAAPVAEHSNVYAEIHDSLLAALDAEER